MLMRQRVKRVSVTREVKVLMVLQRVKSVSGSNTVLGFKMSVV